MDPASSSQPDASTNTSVDGTAQQSNPEDKILNVILSDKFQEDFQKRQNALPEDDPMRAEACFRMGGQFHFYYLKTSSFDLLDRAISLTKQAVENSSKSRDRIDTYVAVYSHLLQQKASKTQNLEDGERYLEGLRLGISLLEECDLKEKHKRELGCAYFSNYNQTKNPDRLKLAMETLEQCFETSTGKHPQATIYLGAALLDRYHQGKQLNDLIRVVELLYHGLEAMSSDNTSSHAQLRDFGLNCLISASATACTAPCGPGIRTQLISYLDLVIQSTPVDCHQVTQLKRCRDALHESIKGPVETATLLYRLSQRSFGYWKSQGNVNSLDDAIKFAQEALMDLPNGHDLILEYARVLVFVAQTKAITFQNAETTEQYISAIKKAIDGTLTMKAANDQFIQRLAWAYWGRYELSKTNEDLDNVIEYINGLIDAHHEILPHTELILGQAFHSRFSRSKDVDDIEKALSLFEEALQSPEAGQPVRDVMLQNLVQYAIDVLLKRPGAENLTRLIKNAQFAIPELPPSESKERIEKILSKMQTYEELLNQQKMLAQVFESLVDLNLNKKGRYKPTGNTVTPQELYVTCKIGQANFRTLELLPGKPEQEIACKLHRVEFSSNVQYEALSYTWGDPDEVSEIIVENLKCKVTVNLGLALKRLRHPEQSRVLWIDAVCINQDDFQERSQQVTMMGDIYKQASRVLTWLGEPSPPKDLDTKQSASPPAPNYSLLSIKWGNDESDMSMMKAFFTNENQFDDWPVVGALSTLMLLSKDCHLNTLPFFQDPRYIDFNIGIYPSDLWRKCCSALMEILDSSYWRRVWVVQEIALGAQVLLHHGRHIIPLDILFNAARRMRKHYYGCCYHHCAADTNNKWSNVFSILNGLDSIADFDSLRSPNKPSGIEHLSNVLLAGMDFREATDPRDQVYGLLGLVPDFQNDPLLRPDYNLPISQVYTGAAFKIMRDSGDLRLLSYADRIRRVEGLPSWCHDFAEKGIFNPYPNGWDFFNACSVNSKTEFEINLKSNSGLEVRGFHLDTVTEVTDARTPESLPRSALSRWIDEGLALARKHCATKDSVYKTDPPIHIEEAYVRVLIGDTFTLADGSTRRATYEDIELFYGWLTWINESVRPGTKDWAARRLPIMFGEIFTTFMTRTQSRKLFATKSRRLGTGISIVFGEEKEASPNDQVWLLQGSRLPVILRPISVKPNRKEGTAETPFTDESHYALISTAYIHGIMDGETSPSSTSFKDITLGQYPKPSKSPIPANEPMRDALRMSHILGHGSGRNERHRSRITPKPKAESNRQDDAQSKEESGKDTGINAESLLFPEGRVWPDSLKRIPQHRVILVALFQNLPETEEGWEELESNLIDSIEKKKAIEKGPVPHVALGTRGSGSIG